MQCLRLFLQLARGSGAPLVSEGCPHVLRCAAAAMETRRPAIKIRMQKLRWQSVDQACGKKRNVALLIFIASTSHSNAVTPVPGPPSQMVMRWDSATLCFRKSTSCCQSLVSVRQSPMSSIQHVACIHHVVCRRLNAQEPMPAAPQAPAARAEAARAAMRPTCKTPVGEVSASPVGRRPRGASRGPVF